MFDERRKLVWIAFFVCSGVIALGFVTWAVITIGNSKYDISISFLVIDVLLVPPLSSACRPTHLVTLYGSFRVKYRKS